MAVTVTALLTDVTLGESTDDGYWTGSDGYSAEIYRQGSASQGWIVAKNGNETASFDYYSKATATLDMSGTGVHLYITMRCDVAPFIDYVHFGLSSDTAHGASTTGTTYWTVVDNTTNVEWAGEWITIKLDVNSSTTFSTTGTLDLSAIDTVHINVDNSNSGNIRSIENTYIDAIRFGTGLKLTGTAWDWQDVADDDNLNANKYDIVRAVGPGVFEINGQLQIGDGATTTTPASVNETLFFKDISTSGIEGGPIGKQASGFYKITVTGSGCTCDFDNMSVLASSNAPYVFDADDTGLPASSIDWNGGTLVQCSSFLSDGSQTFANMGFYSCGQVDPSTSNFTDFLIKDYTGSEGGALLWGGGTTTKDGVFDNNLKSIEITQAANQTYDNITFLNEDNSTKQSTHLNNGGTNIDVSKTNGSNPQYYTATGGGTVTFVGAAVTAQVTVTDANGDPIENALVLVKASDDAGPFPQEDSVTISNSGTTATVTHTAHGMATNDYVDIQGASLAANNGVFQITYINANSYSYTMASSPGSSPTGTITSTFIAIYGLTNASGVKAATSRVYPSNQNVTGWARKSTSSPYYQEGPINGTVNSTSGLSTTAVLIPDE